MISNIDAWSAAGRLALIFAAAVIVSGGLIVVLRPLLMRYALARPNARSSHRNPTPQGGGIAVIAATMAAMAAAAVLAPEFLTPSIGLVVVLAAAVGLAVLGATDDIHPLEAAPRLLLQAIAAAVVIAMLPADLRIVPVLPWWIERVVLLIALLWFVNLVNFMDGIDWMTVVEAAPLSAGLTLFGIFGAMPKEATLVALALCGALLGFAPFNRPVARLFLGDVGSLPIGLLLGWMLVLLAGRGHLAAALLLPLYYVADTTITLLRRLRKGESIMKAHRSHFYQHALDTGFTVYQIVGRVFALNLILIALGVFTFANPAPAAQVGALIAGGMCVAALLWDFGRPPQRS